ncbi:MAG: hypothetical protein Q7J22_01580 [Candidatus Wolfebacteria bacterium]|nr:hypothetical protein [Candidatus Wolfebacteria bacterium]MDP2704357.1 hypothetical protein [bacterium]
MTTHGGVMPPVGRKLLLPPFSGTSLSQREEILKERDSLSLPKLDEIAKLLLSHLIILQVKEEKGLSQGPPFRRGLATVRILGNPKPTRGEFPVGEKFSQMRKLTSCTGTIDHAHTLLIGKRREPLPTHISRDPVQKHITSLKKTQKST